MAKITLYVPDQAPQKFDLADTEEISIGRASDCDIILDHTSVSGHHAFIRKIGAGMHVLVDNGSTNGIYLEGNQVPEAPLTSGASFNIGQVPAEYEGDAPASSDSAPAGAEPTASNSGGGNNYGAPTAQIAETSARPAGFTDMSPIEKVEKPDGLGKIAMIVGLLAILVVVGLVIMTVLMGA